MPAFPQIPDDKKWDVAFYVMSLPSQENSGAYSEAFIAGINNELKDYKNLSTLTNDQLKDSPSKSGRMTECQLAQEVLYHFELVSILQLYNIKPIVPDALLTMHQ